MVSVTHHRVLVAHRRAPVQRLIRTNLRADGLPVLTASTPGACLKALQAGMVDALVLDADLVRGDAPESAELLRYLLSVRVPTLLVSWDPGDRLLARALHNAPFLSRPDNVDQITEQVQGLLRLGVPA